jgi:hypothetical protein
MFHLEIEIYMTNIMHQEDQMTSSRLQIEQSVVGPLSSNCCIVCDANVKVGVIIDPSENAQIILRTVRELSVETRESWEY